MSLSAAVAAMDARTGDPAAKLVLLALGDWADEMGRSFVSVKDLAAFAEIDPEEVESKLAHLQHIGLIRLDVADEKVVATFQGIAA